MFRHPVWNKRQIDIVFTSMETCDSMSEAEQPLRPSDPHRVFYGPSELRAGWRLFIFLAIVSAMIIATNRVVRLLLPGADATTLFLVFQVINFLIFLSASWVIWRIEGRTIADYGLPWRRMFRAQFWQGALLGFASVTGLLAMRAAGVFYFGGIASRVRRLEADLAPTGNVKDSRDFSFALEIRVTPV
jgi:hypothetical protein